MQKMFRMCAKMSPLPAGGGGLLLDRNYARAGAAVFTAGDRV